MNLKRYFIASIVAFAFVFGFDFLVHAMWLEGPYAETASLWRPMEEYQSLMHFMLISQIGLAFIVVFIYTRNVEGGCLKEGLRFGLYIGLLLAVLEVGKYAYMPIPMDLMLSWAGAGLVKGLVLGVIAKLLYKL